MLLRHDPGGPDVDERPQRSLAPRVDLTRSLVGRGDDIAELAGALAAGTHQVLTAGPGCGKTSVALKAFAALDPQQWIQVRVDLSRTASLSDLVRQITTKPAPETAPPPRTRGEDLGGLHAAIGELQDAASEQGRRIALLIDGIDDFLTTQLFGKPEEVLTGLRAAVEVAPSITCLFTAGTAQALTKLYTEAEQPWTGFVQAHPLAPVPPTAWALWLRKQIAAHGYEIGDGPLGAIIDLGDSHPRSVIYLARCSGHCAEVRGSAVISAGDVALGYELAIAADYNAHRHQLSRLRTLGKHAFAITLRVAQCEPPYKLLPPAVVHQTLRSLELAGVVHHPEAGTWKISDPLFRHYLLAIAAGTDSSTAAPAAEPSIPAVLEPPAEADSADPIDAAFGAGHLALRTPEPFEAAAVAASVAVATSAAHPATIRLHRNGLVSAGGLRVRSERDRQRLVDTVQHLVDAHPARYRQLDIDGEARGGLALVGPAGPDRSATTLTRQVTALAAAFALATCALGILLHAQVWRRGTMGDALLAAFATCLVLVGLALRACRCQARTESLARRSGGLRCLGLWACAGSLTDLFKALAHDCPDTVVTAHARDRREVELYRSLGFTMEQGQVATGRLDPYSDKPVRPHHRHLDAPAEIQAGAPRLS